MSDIALTVYDADLTTEIATLDQAYQVSWSDERYDVGAGEFVIPHDSPIVQANPQILAAGNLVKVAVDATDRFAWVIRRRARQRGDVWDPIQITGVGAADLLSESPVYPRGGLNSVGASDRRIFSWRTDEFDDSGWEDVDGYRVGSVISTPGYPDPDAVGFEPELPGDRALYRRLMASTSGLEGPARMVLAASYASTVTVYLDGEEVLHKEAGQRGLITADVDYREFDQQLAVEVVGGTGRWGWTWIRLNEPTNDDDETTYGDVIRRTFDPADAPGADPWKVYEGGGIADWIDAGYDDSSWDDPLVSPGGISTAGWPDGAAVALQATSTWGRYRRTVGDATNDGPARMYVVATYSTSVRVFLDGVEVLHKPAGQTGIFEAEVAYPSSSQQLAFAVIGGTGRWAWTWQAGADGSGGTIRRTYDPESESPSEPMVYEPISYPGVTPGFILKTLFDEAQADGRDEQPSLTSGFTAAVDSAGNDWPEIEFACQVGDDTILSVAERLRDYGVDHTVTPALVFEAWHRRGVDRGGTPDGGVSTVTIPLAEVYSLGEETEDDKINRMLVRTERSWGEIQQLGDGRPIGAYLSLGMQPSEEGARRVTLDLLDDFAGPRAQLRFAYREISGTPSPVADYDVGDVVVGPWLDPDDLTGSWSTDDIRINTVAALLTPSGDVEWAVEAGAP